ncbi:aminodeoxychorismate synthase component I [Shumkonia mesophila]|uniref:aminodeoxychorismate synthase component I n=1 Tax=Shumkonia mesophila TaxID=2838854 RepID=UPI0029351848|nr:aminodeoxychorismate synthase component I [Shumkonia mesophila]
MSAAAPPRPLARAIPFVEPADAFAAFAADPVAALLDSAAPAGGRGRYAYIAADPFRVLTWRWGDAGDPLALLAAGLAGRPLAANPGLPPFQGGAVGFLGYELAGTLERLAPPAAAGPALPDLFFAFYDTVAAFDLEDRKAWAIAADVAAAGPRPPAGRRLEALAARLAAAPAPPNDPGTASSWRAETPRPDYEAKVARTVDYIRAGDIYQANLSQRFLAPRPPGLTPYLLHRRVRAASPAPFAALLACGPGQTVVSASPERFLRLAADGAIETRPIKGTRRRGADAAEDAALARQLMASAKDRAENLMIVDLLRNDLSRVAVTGSVGVPALCELESFASIHHLVSVIEARLKPGLGPVDLLRAAFPGGSITGAPKIRAMEIIRELEPARRGPYCGAIAWIGFDGAMDSSIVIRTLVVDGDDVILQAGGGIVADSQPAAEYEETLDKARPLMACLDPRKGGGIR